MEIKRIITGAFETNTYILKEGSSLLIIDPSGKAEKLLPLINGDLLAILLTHGHFDHIKAVDGLFKVYGCPIYLFKEDRELVDGKTSKEYNRMGPFTASINSPINDLHQGKMKIAPFEFDVYKTPGHTKGSGIFKFDDVIFSGDTLFKESVGRSDLYGGCERDLKESLKLFKEFALDTLIYPGHGEASDIAHECKNNPFLKNI